MPTKPKAPAPTRAAAKPRSTKAAPAPKPAKPVSPAKTPKAAEKPAEEKVKAKKTKLVRDSFTMPKDEYEQIAVLKLSLAKQGRPAKKSELLRAGLMLLGKQSAGALLASVEALAPVKTGRPKKD